MKTKPKYSFAVVLLLFISSTVICHAQVNSVNVTDSVVILPSEKTGVADLINVCPSNDLQPAWQNQINIYNIEHEGPDAKEIERIKEEKNHLKEQNAEIPEISAFRSSGSAVVQPIAGQSFTANLPLQGTPPDNSIAISNSGIIVSAINSNIIYYDKTGTKLFEKTFSDFLNDTTNLKSTLYDPVVMYDSKDDRFIFVLLHGSTSTTSKIIVCFSKTNNPMDGWNVYYINATTVYTGSRWFDFPNIGISTNDLFISTNVFYDDETFYEVNILQLTKQRGYKGFQITYKQWNNLRNPENEKPFTLVPATYGHQGTTGPGIYFVSTKQGGSSKVHLWKIDNDQDLNPKMTSYTISTTAYSVPGDALQKYTTGLNPGKLDCGDCRVMEAFYLDNTIHFVFQADAGNGYSGIFYNRLNVNTKVLTTKSLSLSGFDLAFPSLASSSPNGSTEKDVIIAYLMSGSTIYPEFRAVRCDNDMNFSDPIVLKAGENCVDIVDGGERWGDYTGISRQHSTTAPSIWVSGCYGANIKVGVTKRYKTWITELRDQETNDINKTEITSENEINVFPNPVSDIFSLRYNLDEEAFVSISIFDLQGKLVRTLYEDKAPAGLIFLSFNKAALSQGSYFITIKANGEIKSSEKIIVQ